MTTSEEWAEKFAHRVPQEAAGRSGSIVRVIDIETSDLDPGKAHIVEIAAVDIVEAAGLSWKIKRLRSRYVKLPEGASVSPEASAIHQILSEDLDTAEPLAEAIEAFKADGEVAHFVAHHAAFEQGFLKDLLGPVPWVCTWKCALRVWPDFPSHKNQALRYRLGLYNPLGERREGISPHQAASDAIVTGAIFAELAKRASRSELIQWSAEPALLASIKFGTYKDKPFADIAAENPGYLEWILREDFDENVKFTARHWLARRTEAARP